MVKLDLHYVDELLTVRHQQHGGNVGAPIKTGGYREGQSINRSAIVMLSALTQVYIEEVFVELSAKALAPLSAEADQKFYRETIRRWGNPSADNIKSLFARLGVRDVLSGLTWQSSTNASIRKRLNDLNQIRNQIAHGSKTLIVNQKKYSLSLSEVWRYHSFIRAFSTNFEKHATSIVVP